MGTQTGTEGGTEGERSWPQAQTGPWKEPALPTPKSPDLHAPAPGGNGLSVVKPPSLPFVGQPRCSPEEGGWGRRSGGALGGSPGWRWGEATFLQLWKALLF